MVAELHSKQNALCSRLIQEAKATVANENSSKDDIEEAVEKIVQVRMGMPQHKQLMHTLEDGALLKKVEKAEMFIRSDQNRGLLQEVQNDNLRQLMWIQK